MMNARKILLGGLALFLGAVAVSAQTTYILTLNGTIQTSVNAYGNSGDAFTATFTLQSPVATSGAPGNYFVATSSSAGDDPFQDTTTTGTHATTTGQSGTARDDGATVAILSGYAGYGHPPTPIYGYQFNSGESAPATYQPGYEFWQMTIALEGYGSLVAPTGTLADLGNFPINPDFGFVASFNVSELQAVYSGTNFQAYNSVASETGVITSYTIRAVTTPEPATWMLFGAGVVAIGGMRRRMLSA